MAEVQDRKDTLWTEHGDYRPARRLHRIEPRKYEIFSELADWFIFDHEAHCYPMTHAIREGRLLVSDKLGRVKVDSFMTHDRYPPAFGRSSPPEVLLEYMDRNGVDIANLTQCNSHGYWNEFVAECVQKWPDRFVGTALVSMDWDDLTMMELEEWNSRGLSILNLSLMTVSPWLDPDDEQGYRPDPLRPDSRFNAPYMQRFWDKFSEWEWVITLMLPRRAPRGAMVRICGDLQEIAQQYPRISFVQEHMCFPSFPFFEERSRLLRDNPNVYTEIGCASHGIFVLEDSRQMTAQRYLRRLIDEFDGENKIMFGSDYPYTLVHATYWQQVDWIFRQCEFLTDVQRQKILGLNAVRAHHLENRLAEINQRKQLLKEKQGVYYDPYYVFGG
jgi:predicted TIM-barrel fold metal-dependent hydrolase